MEAKKSMKKRILSLTLALLMVLALCACGSTAAPAASTAPAAPAASEAPAAESEDHEIKFAIMFGVGGLGDMAFNDEVNEGCIMACEQFGVTYDYCEPTDVSEFETQLRAYADAGEYDTIIAISTEMVDALKMVAEDYPEQRFCMLDTAITDYDNIHCLTASHPEQHFLSGVLAGIVTQDDRFALANEDNKLGFCIAMDTPTSNAQAAGFLAGAKYINPEVEFMTAYIGGYNDPATAKELATTMYERGADIVSTNSGSSANGVFNAARELDKYVIGTSLGMVDGDHSLSTSMKYVQNFIVAEIRALVEGTWAPGVDVYGIKDGVCDYSLQGVNTEIPQDIIDTIDKVKALVADGTLVLPTHPSEVDAWIANNTYEG